LVILSVAAMESRVRGETFQGHWAQLRGIAAMQETVPTPDDMVAVLNLLDHMTSLLDLELEAERGESSSASEATAAADTNGASNGEPNLDSLPMVDRKMPCLDLLLSENILSHILATSRMPIDAQHADQLRNQQLILYETLLRSTQAQTLLSHQPFIRPLIDLLNQFDKGSRNGTVARGVTLSSSTETEFHLVVLLNQLCVRLMENLELLRFFFHADSAVGSSSSNSTNSRRNSCSDSSSSSSFLVFSLLVGFLHREGHVGQQARDALINVMAMSRKNEGVGNYIAKHSNFCPILATGLSGLYSALPRRLSPWCESSPGWHRISADDLREMPELALFLSSLQFCDAVLQVAHPSVREHLLALIYMGFLVPVMGPALTQVAESELICTTSYVELFLRRISEPSLLAVFLRFLFTETCDDKNIVDQLTLRIGCQTKLCAVTLALFETLLALNCEDVMLWLVLRHLIPLRHLLPSQRGTDSIAKPDLHGRAAEKLLSLTPICCQEATAAAAAAEAKRPQHSTPSSLSFLLGRPSAQSTPTSHRTSSDSEREPSKSSSSSSGENFRQYLLDARRMVREKQDASSAWLYDYDGLNPPPEALVSDAKANSGKRCDSNSGMSICDNNGSDASAAEGAAAHGASASASPNTAASSGYTSLNNHPHAVTENGGDNIGGADEEEDREFWNLMKDPAVSEVKMNRAIKRMVQARDDGDCDLSESSGGERLSLNGGGLSSRSSPEISPRTRLKREEPDVDFTVTSLGCFLDLLLEKVELMASNSLTTNLLTTSILSQLASFPQPVLRSALLTPDVVFQPSVRGLYTALASLKQKLDNIMPTLPNSEEAVLAARRYLAERLMGEKAPSSSSMRKGRRDSNTSVASTLSQLGQEARSTRVSFSNAISSMFGSAKSHSSSSSSAAARRASNPPAPAAAAAQSASSPGSLLGGGPTAADSPLSSPSALGAPDSLLTPYGHLSREVRQQALAAVILEEWLTELAAVAQEQSVLQKELAFEVGMGLRPQRDNAFQGVAK